MSQPTYHRALHLIALLTVVTTFPLIFMGGLVTSHGAGMSVPDWPNSYGYNMFTFPPSKWVGGIWYEHVHRLTATAVGYLAILLTMCAWAPARSAIGRRRIGRIAAGFLLAAAIATIALVASWRAQAIAYETMKFYSHFVVGAASIGLIAAAAWLSRQREERRWARWLAVGVLVAVSIQGLLGGLRVTEVNLTLAIIHGCFAQAFFCLAAAMAVVTSRWWIERPASANPENPQRFRRLAILGTVAVLTIYLQLVVGAVMRHYEAGLAVPDLPLAYGQVLPATDADSLARINSDRAWNLHLDAVTAGQIWWHMGHRIGAIVVTIALVALLIHAWRQHADQSKLTRPAWIIAVLLTTQITLGVLTVLWRKPADIASAHVAVGALLLMTAFILTLRAFRLHDASRRAPIAGFVRRNDEDSIPATTRNPLAV